MKILVTGGTGFVGRQLVPYLVRRGNDVTAVVRDPQAAVAAPQLCLSDIDQITENTLEGFEAIVHLAGIAHRQGSEPEAVYDRVNHLETARLASVASDAGVNRFVFLSTSKVHGDGGSDVIRSDSPIRPLDDYSASKARAEAALNGLETGMIRVSLRPPVIYGPDPKGNVKKLVKVASGHRPFPVPAAANRRSFLHMGNLLSAIEASLKINEPGSHGFVLADRKAVSTQEMIIEFAKQHGGKPILIRVPTGLLALLDSGGKLLTGRRMLAPVYSDFKIDSSDFELATGWSAEFTLEDAAASDTEGSSPQNHKGANSDGPRIQ